MPSREYDTNKRFLFRKFCYDYRRSTHSPLSFSSAVMFGFTYTLAVSCPSPITTWIISSSSKYRICVLFMVESPRLHSEVNLQTTCRVNRYWRYGIAFPILGYHDLLLPMQININFPSSSSIRISVRAESISTPVT